MCDTWLWNHLQVCHTSASSGLTRSLLTYFGVAVNWVPFQNRQHRRHRIAPDIRDFFCFVTRRVSCPKRYDRMRYVGDFCLVSEFPTRPVSCRADTTSYPTRDILVVPNQNEARTLRNKKQNEKQHPYPCHKEWRFK